MNGRYLWVDKYSIDQQDAAKRHRQIKSMNDIYQCALATIIAAAGEDASYGLPGVNGKERKAQLTAKFGGIELASGLSRLPVVLQDSKWASRGWTYQEAVLSSRCIYFTKDQVYFTCKCSRNCKAVNFTQANQQFSKSLTNFGTDIFDTDIRVPGRQREGLWNFFDHLYHYKSRNLSYRTDSLNAFQGILAKFPYITISGAPIASANSLRSQDEDELTHGFARGLWWLELSRNERIHMVRQSSYPSWSWAGWTGKIPAMVSAKRSNFEYDRICDIISSIDVKFWLEHEIYGQLFLTQLVQLSDTIGYHFDTLRVLHIEANVFKMTISAAPKPSNSLKACQCS